MKWPQLVLASVCTTLIRVVVTDGINEDSTPRQILLFEGMCNYSEKSKNILDAERRLITLEATAFIPGDIAPGKDISGDAVINNGEVTRCIYRSSRGRNPDGKVNFTQLELM